MVSGQIIVIHWSENFGYFGIATPILTIITIEVATCDRDKLSKYIIIISHYGTIFVGGINIFPMVHYIAHYIPLYQYITTDYFHDIPQFSPSVHQSKMPDQRCERLPAEPPPLAPGCGHLQHGWPEEKCPNSSYTMVIPWFLMAFNVINGCKWIQISYTMVV